MGRAEAELSGLLGIRLQLAWATEPLSPTALTGGEAAQWQSRAPGPRRQDWLLGRAALRAVLGDGGDTSELVFPHPALSLAHAGGVAVAVRSDARLRGIGVDFEPRRPDVDPRAARFFLSRLEQAAGQGTETLLRLWTIKEALYKATPDNQACLLVDFELADPTAAAGDALGPRGEALRYAAVDVPAGHLAVAVCPASICAEGVCPESVGTGRQHAPV